MSTPNDGAIPTAEQVEEMRKFIIAQKTKIRAGCKMTIDTTTLETRNWPTIEMWLKAKRQYLPLSIGGIWRYDTDEARDAVLNMLAARTEGQSQ